MDQYSRWSGIVHSSLRSHAPKIKLGQVHQLLAACLGHRTYASLRKTDLEILNRQPRYVLFDREAGLKRATELNLRITDEQWQQACMLLHPSGITPFWLTSVRGMHLAARLTFEDSADSRICELQNAIGFPDGCMGASVHCHSTDDEVPEVLRFSVEGEVNANDKEGRYAIPVRTIVEFSKIGRRMYGEGSLVMVEQCGQARLRDLDEYDDAGDFFGMSED